MRNNRNVIFVAFLAVLTLSEMGLLKLLSSLIHQYGDLWENVLSATGFGSAAIATIKKLVSLIE